MQTIWTWTFRLAAISLPATLAAVAGLPWPEALRYRTVPENVVEARLKEFAGDNQRRAATLKRLFEEAGCSGGRLTEQPVEGAKPPNVICVQPGKSQRTIIVGAHFDHTPEGDGVVDNWSGASLLPSLYQSVHGAEREHTYVFIGFAAEEEGEIGSRFYVHEMSKDAIQLTDAMVNLDTLGLGPTLVWESHSDKLLTKALSYLAKRLDLPLDAVNVENVGSSDSEQFAEKKIPRITVHSLNQQRYEEGILHTPKDRLSAIKFDDYYRTYRLMAAYVAFLDELPPRQDAREPR